MSDIKPAYKRTITAAYTKADSTPGQVEGVPVWTLSDPLLGTLTPAVDGMSATIAHKAPGSATVEVTADGDLGAGVHPIVLSEVFTMLAPLGAEAGTLSVGEEAPA
ncbi:MAG: hypothetical protein ACHBMF_03740 [Chromatiales bacterium]